MTPDQTLVALMKLTSEERLSVLRLLPEWEKLTRPNEFRAAIRREVLDAIIDVGVGARGHYDGGGDPLGALVRVARDRSARLRVEEKAGKAKDG